MTRIALLHPGEMGAAVGGALVALGHTVVWLPEGRSADTRRRAEAAGLVAAADVAECELVVSVVPPQFAVETAKRIDGFTGLYLDANAISPRTAGDVAAVATEHGATYVDGGIIGPPPHRRGTTRLYLSGDHAADVAALCSDAAFEAIVVAGAGPTAASAVKMAFAAWTKISAALVLAAHDTADAAGVADVLDAEWARSGPELAARLEAAKRSATEKGWRWTDEMRQIASTFADADRPAGFGEAAAEIFSRYPRP